MQTCNKKPHDEVSCSWPHVCLASGRSVPFCAWSRASAHNLPQRRQQKTSWCISLKTPICVPSMQRGSPSVSPAPLCCALPEILSHGNRVYGFVLSCSHHCLVQCPRICSLPDVSGVRWLVCLPIDRLHTQCEDSHSCIGCPSWMT